MSALQTMRIDSTSFQAAHSTSEEVRNSGTPSGATIVEIINGTGAVHADEGLC
jgi:hypothetical protein